MAAFIALVKSFLSFCKIEYRGVMLQTVYLFREFDYIIGLAVKYPTKLFHCHHCDVFVLFQRVQGFIINPRFQEPVLGNVSLFHGFP